MGWDGSSKWFGLDPEGGLGWMQKVGWVGSRRWVWLDPENGLGGIYKVGQIEKVSQMVGWIGSRTDILLLYIPELCSSSVSSKPETRPSPTVTTSSQSK